MNHLIVLNEIQIENIRKLAEEERRTLGFVGETPIASSIFTILEKLNIRLLEYPIKSEKEKPAFSAALMYSKESGQELIFIGLNTADYFDKQIFAIAHELYHFYTKSCSHLSRSAEEADNLIENQANRFAAEFLLPENILKSILLNEFKSSTLKEIQIKTLLRFIARLHCNWWLPYKSIVKRLKEIDSISEQQYEHLYCIDERDMEGKYGCIGKNLNKDVFLKLNSVTNNIGISPKDLDLIIRNFEDNIIDEDKFVDTLYLFNKKPDDFGYDFQIAENADNEFEEFLNGEVDNES